MSSCDELFSEIKPGDALRVRAALDSDPARAARLLGAAEALRVQAEAPMWAHERADCDAARECLRAALDPAALERAWGECARMSAREAIALAVQ